MRDFIAHITIAIPAQFAEGMDRAEMDAILKEQLARFGAVSVAVDRLDPVPSQRN